jgi:hypothetical protein
MYAIELIVFHLHLGLPTDFLPRDFPSNQSSNLKIHEDPSRLLGFVHRWNPAQWRVTVSGHAYRSQNGK